MPMVGGVHDQRATPHVLRAELIDDRGTGCGLVADHCTSGQSGELLDDVARRRVGEVLIAKLNTDRNPATGMRFGIRGIPTIILFREGKEIARRVGAVPPTDLEALVNSA